MRGRVGFGMGVAVATALAIALIAPVGCAPSGPPKGGELEGAYEVVRLAGKTRPVPGTRIEFGPSDRLSGFSGVNTFQGSWYAEDEGSLSIENLASTLMAGPPASMLGEQAFLDALADVRSYARFGDNAVLYSADDQVLIQLAREKEARLTGVTWLLVGYADGTGGVIAARPKGNVTATFGASDRLEGRTGCGRYRCTYAVSGATIEIGDLKSVKTSPCPTKLASERALYLDAIQKATSWRISTTSNAGDTMLELELRDPTGELMARFEASRR